jgi:CO/xanthine dehydrogenase FAD-binding subunit
VQLYIRPTQLSGALALLADPSGPAFTLLAGGTDFYPARPIPRPGERILDITGLAGLRTIERRDGGWWIPCLATWSDLLAQDLPPWFDGLKQAARQVGGRQIQNAGTVVGNLCNASPAADGMPCLLALGATITLASMRGQRVISVDDFVTGARLTALASDEMAIGIHVPDNGGVAGFEKLGARAYLVISIVMVAAWVRIEHGRILAARIAVGACGARAALLPDLAMSLIGQDCANAIVLPELLQGLTPIDDIRGTARYRQDAALELVHRAVRNLACRPEMAA